MDVQNISRSQSQRAKPDTSFENSNFISNGFLKVPINLLSRDLLIKIVDLLLVHIGEVKDSYSGLEKANDIIEESQNRHCYKVLEAQSCGGIPTKSNENSFLEDGKYIDMPSQVLENTSCKSGEIPRKSSCSDKKLRICSFCRQRHKLGYSYCPAYGTVCNYCRKLNHHRKACWNLYPEFYRFQKGKVSYKYADNGKCRKADGLGAAPESDNNKPFVGNVDEAKQLKLEKVEAKDIESNDNSENIMVSLDDSEDLKKTELFNEKNSNEETRLRDVKAEENAELGTSSFENGKAVNMEQQSTC